MRRWFAGMCAGLLVCLLAAGAFAQQKKTNFFITGGIAAPASNKLSEFWDPGFNLGGGVEHFFRPKLAFQGAFGYSRLGLDEGKFLSENDAFGSATASGGAITLFTVFANLKFSKTADPEEDVRALPYFVLGAGFMRFSPAEIRVVEISGNLADVEQLGSSGALAFNAGGGLNIRMTDRMGLFFEARYEVGFTSGDSTQLFPARVGLSIQ